MHGLYGEYEPMVWIIWDIYVTRRMGVTQCCIVVVLRMREWMARWDRIRSGVRPSSNELETIDEKEPSRQKHAADPLPGVGLTRPPTDGLVDRMSAAEGAAELQRGVLPIPSHGRTNEAIRTGTGTRSRSVS